MNSPTSHNSETDMGNIISTPNQELLKLSKIKLNPNNLDSAAVMAMFTSIQLSVNGMRKKMKEEMSSTKRSLNSGVDIMEEV